MAIADSLARLAASRLATVRTRLELATVEFEEETLRLFDYLLHSLIALFFLGLAFTLLVVLVLVLFWDSHRIAILIGLTLVFGAIGLRISQTARYKYQHKPPMLQDTLAELAKDMAALRAATETANEATNQAASHQQPPSAPKS